MSENSDWPAMAREGVRFFGLVTAAVSHEINNRLAVINEMAGLTEDLALMLARGKDIDPERFEEQGKKIVEQVRLAKILVQNLNRFAHSADEELAEIEVTEILDLVAALYERKARMADAELLIAESNEPVTVMTNPFMLANLLGRGIEVALSRIGETGTTTLYAENTEGGISVTFHGLAGLSEPIELPGSTRDDVGKILELFGGSYRVEPDGSALILEITDHERLLHGRSE